MKSCWQSMTSYCKVTGHITCKVDKAIRKESTESDSWMMTALSALKGEAARKREAKGKPEDGNILSASSEKGGLTSSKSHW